MAHPLNRAAFDRRSGRVVDGYGGPPAAGHRHHPDRRGTSLFQRIFAGPAGIDPYASAISDVYQDLFGEGIVHRQGDLRRRRLRGGPRRAASPRTLSSVTIYSKASSPARGLVTDIELFDDFPADYEVAPGRQHRWVRGDWQLLPWIIRRRRRRRSADAASPLIGAWKIVDNLRRSLVRPRLPGCSSSPAGRLPGSPALVWTAFVLAIARTARSPARARRGHPRPIGDVEADSHPRRRTELRLASTQIALGIIFLAHQAWLMTDAIARTLVRLFLTRRRLLEWTTAAQAESDRSRDVASVYRRMRARRDPAPSRPPPSSRSCARSAPRSAAPFALSGHSPRWSLAG